MCLIDSSGAGGRGSALDSQSGMSGKHPSDSPRPDTDGTDGKGWNAAAAAAAAEGKEERKLQKVEEVSSPERREDELVGGVFAMWKFFQSLLEF